MSYTLLNNNINDPYEKNYYKNLFKKKDKTLKLIKNINYQSFDNKYLYHLIITMYALINDNKKLIRQHKTFCLWMFHYIIRNRNFWTLYNKNCLKLDKILDNILYILGE